LLAKAYVRAERDEEAVIELRNTIDHPHAPMAARTLLETIYREGSRKGYLQEFYQDTLKKFPDSVFWHNRAAAFALDEGDFDKAVQFYGLAWQKAKANDYSGGTRRGTDGRFETQLTALDGYLRALTLAGKLDKVVEEGRQYVDGDFAPIAYLRMAEAKWKLGDKTTAREYCQNAVDKAGTNEILLSQSLKGTYSLLGAEEALRHWEQRHRADPDSLVSNLAMFYLTRINGEYNKAVGYIDKCLQIVGPDSPQKGNYTVKKAEVLQLAYLKTSDNNYRTKTIVVYESLLAEMPNNTGVLNNLAYLLAENNERLSEALKYAERAYELGPGIPSILDTYAYVLYKNDRLQEADEFLQAAIQQYEQDMASVPAEVYEHLGMVKEKSGSKSEALAAYEQALDVATDEFSKATRERVAQAVERLSP
jgi:tetratricopeptide (TPR) repeat protein